MIELIKDIIIVYKSKKELLLSVANILSTAATVFKQHKRIIGNINLFILVLI